MERREIGTADRDREAGLPSRGKKYFARIKFLPSCCASGASTNSDQTVERVNI